MRAALDANVLLSGLLHGRTTRPILLAMIARHFRLVTSETLLGELTEVLSRPEWLRTLDATECRELLAIIREAGTFVTPTHRITACRDPEDNALLECAIAGRADYLVTGDLDLLALHPFRGIHILRPAEFLRLLA